MTEEELSKLEREKELKKSRVRVRLTYWAGAYVFGGGAALAALCVMSIWITKLDNAALGVAKDFYLLVLPVATGIITYWFATRSSAGKSADNRGTREQQESTNVNNEKGERE